LCVAKKGFFRRIAEKLGFLKPETEVSAPPAPVAPPAEAPKVRHATPGERAQAYIDDLQRKGKIARFPKDETSEFWRQFDERGGSPS
jgi:hypothetical protein